MLKLFAWEFSFERRVAEARGQEVRCILKMAMLYLVLGICSYMLSFLVSTRGGGGYHHKYHFCRDKKFCRDKHVFVTTKKSFVATKVCLSRQNFCRDAFDPANDMYEEA